MRFARTTLTHSFAIRCIKSALLLLACSAHGQQHDRNIAIGPNVQVSRAHSTLVHTEVLLSADPDDANYLFGCSMAFSPTLNHTLAIGYISRDGGSSWVPAIEYDNFRSVDPSCALGLGGIAYFAAIEETESLRRRLVFSRSTNRGKSWSSPEIVPFSDSIDREWIAPDNSSNKSSTSNLYLYGQIEQRNLDGAVLPMTVALWRSLDHGQSFQGPLVRPPASPVAYDPGNAIVLSNGTLVALVAELDPSKRNDGYLGASYGIANMPNGWIKDFTSEDGGNSIASATRVSNIYADWRQGSSLIPALAADPGSRDFKDRLYAAWADGRNGPTQILSSYSTDMGKTWSKPHTIGNEPTPTQSENRVMPALAVNKSGVVGCSWYERSDSVEDTSYSVRFSASLDGGETWLPSIRVSEVANDFRNDAQWTISSGATHRASQGGVDLLTVTVNRYERLSGGDTAGLTADASGRFHAFWVDNRTGVSQVWTSMISVIGDGVRNGSTDLSQMTDLTPKVDLLLSDSFYDRTTNTISVCARIKNTSGSAVLGSLRVRLIAIASKLGNPEVLNADNNEAGPGAVWNFTKYLKNGLLRPNEVSESKVMIFHLPNAPSFRKGNQFAWSLVTMDVRVLGTGH